MRIAQVTHITSPPGESNICALTLSRFLTQLDHEVIVFLNTFELEERQRFLLNGLDIRWLKSSNILSIPYGTKRPVPLSLLPRLLEGFDIIHVHSFMYPSVLIALASRIITRTPVVLSDTGWRWKRNFLAKQVARNLDRIILYDLYGKEYYRCLGVPKERLVLINPGVDVNHFNPHVKGKEVRERLGIENGSVVGFVGRLRARRGIDDLIRAISLVQKKVPDIHLLLVGSGSEEKRLKDLCKEIGVQESVKFVGYQSHADLPKYYAAMDLCVLPSSDPGPFGLVLLEAMACGKPVISSHASPVSQIIREERSGIVVDPKNRDTLVKAIMKLILERRLACSMGRKGRRIVEERYSWNIISRETAILYESLL